MPGLNDRAWRVVHVEDIQDLISSNTLRTDFEKNNHGKWAAQTLIWQLGMSMR